MFIIFLIALVASQNCQNGLKRGCKACACFSGYSGGQCEIPPPQNLTLIPSATISSEVQANVENSDGSISLTSNPPLTSSTKITGYSFTVKQPASPDRKQTTIICGNNINCNYPQSPYWTQSFDGKNDVFSVDMSVFKKYGCSTKNIQYLSSSSVNEINPSNPTDPALSPPQTTQAPVSMTFSQADVVQSKVINMTLQTSIPYPGYLSSPSLPTISIINNCKMGDAMCIQTWDISMICGMSNPYPLMMTINCRTSDPSCQPQSLANMMLMYDNICLLQTIPINIYTFSDMSLSKPKSFYSVGDMVYLSIVSQQCNYQVNNFWLGSNPLIQNFLITNYGYSLNFLYVNNGMGFVMPTITNNDIIIDILLTCSDGSTASRTLRSTIQGNGQVYYSNYAMFYVAIIIFLFICLIIIISHWINRQQKDLISLVFVIIFFSYIASCIITYSLKISYLYSLDTSQNIAYDCFHSVSDMLFLGTVSVILELLVRKLVHRKNSINRYLIISIIFITIHILLTIFDIFIIIFLSYNSYYRAVSHAVTSIMMIIILSLVIYILLKLLFKGLNGRYEIFKASLSIICILFSIICETLYYSLSTYLLFSMNVMEWVEIFNVIHQMLFLVVIVIVF